jgi:hypothetical protein
MTTTAIHPLKESLCYDRAKGEFTWRIPPKFGILAGTRAGSLSGFGYRAIGFKGKRYMEHRLVWLFETGKWPEGEIDHINGNKDDNRFCKLRDVKPQINKQNVRVAKSCSSTGLLGVAPNGRRWSAQIGFNGRKFYLGTYDRPEEAHEAYLNKKRQLHAGCTL